MDMDSDRVYKIPNSEVLKILRSRESYLSQHLIVIERI